MIAAIPIDRSLLCARCHRDIFAGGGPWLGHYHTGWDPAGAICMDCWFDEVDEKQQREWEEWLNSTRTA